MADSHPWRYFFITVIARHDPSGLSRSTVIRYYGPWARGAADLANHGLTRAGFMRVRPSPKVRKQVELQIRGSSGSSDLSITPFWNFPTTLGSPATTLLAFEPPAATFLRTSALHKAAQARRRRARAHEHPVPSRGDSQLCGSQTRGDPGVKLRRRLHFQV